MSSPNALSKTEIKKTHSLTQKQGCLKSYATRSSVSLRREILGAYEISKSLEAEYIKSLHKQIYLFDLENKYLRKEMDKIGATASNSSKHGKDRVKLQKTNAIAANAQMTDDQRDELIKEMVRNCDEIQAKLNGEIALRKEQIDIFTHDILKLKGEKEGIQKDNQKKDQVIAELKENIGMLQDRLVELGAKLETCKQALAIEIKRRKDLERKIEEGKGYFSMSNKDALHHLPTNGETTSKPAKNGKDLCSSICELSKLVTSQAEELKELKKVVYKSEEPRPSIPSCSQIQPKLTDDKRWKEAGGTIEDPQSGMSVVRRRWRDIDDSNTFEEIGIHEDPIQPTEKKKTLLLRT